MKDEKKELVRRIRDTTGSYWEAVAALHDYMVEKDSRMTRAWLIQYVSKIWCEKESEDEADN